MKRTLLLLGTLTFLSATSAWSSDVRVGADIHIRLGDPAPAPYVVSQPPLFLYPQDLGFYVAVGVPFGLFYIDNYYYTPRGGVWYSSPHYNGPWYYVKPGHLPPGLAKNRYRDVIRWRDSEYRNYMRDRDHYRGQKHHPDNRGGKGDRRKGHGKARDNEHRRGHDD